MDAQPPAAGACTVTINRRAQQDVGFREIYVSLDGGPNRMLRHGETVSWSVAPGDHTLVADNTLFKKKEHFALGAGEHAQFVTANTAARGSLSFLAMLGVGILNVSLRREA